MWPRRPVYTMSPAWRHCTGCIKSDITIKVSPYGIPWHVTYTMSPAWRHCTGCIKSDITIKVSPYGIPWHVTSASSIYNDPGLETLYRVYKKWHYHKSISIRNPPGMWPRRPVYTMSPAWRYCTVCIKSDIKLCFITIKVSPYGIPWHVTLASSIYNEPGMEILYSVYQKWH